ncbi:hypothetical protein COLO4_37398 [Corchorus olitorius]|uniref:DNA-directed RNA polymerase subunit n=1 Tax=Corchorus olitorius TaxID=93759 RepID=A0A1R3G215_9ROSI|nr:hypothetical protein COLO4_37398 [Corchorus olitorius]
MSGFEGGAIGPYPNFSFARPIAKKPTFLRLRGSFEYEIQSWKYSIPLFFTTQGFDTFRNREISTGAGAIREQLADLDLRILIDYSLVEWKELGEEGLTGNEWEDRKIGRRKDFLVRRMELAKHFIRTNIEPEWMVLCLLPVLPPELRPIIQIDGGKLMSSDDNELYRRVIYRNNTLTDLLTTSRSTPGELLMCQEKLVQEAVDTLLDNGIRGQPMRDGHNKVYKSFLCQKREKPHPSLSFLRPHVATREGPGGVKGDPINLFRPRIISSWAWSYFTVEKRKKASISKFNSDVARFFLGVKQCQTKIPNKH